MSNRPAGGSAIVTGGGRSIGRGMTLAPAAEGASVVANDFGGPVDGESRDRSPADEPVETIKVTSRAVDPHRPRTRNDPAPWGAGSLRLAR